MDSFSVAGTDPSDAAHKVAEMMTKTHKYGKYKPLSIVKDGVDAFLEYFSFDFIEEDGVEIWCRSTGWKNNTPKT